MVAHELIRFQAPALPSLRDIEPYFAEAERVRWFSNGGPCVTRLERECANALGLLHPGVAVNNATSGLMVALRACLGTPDGERRLVAVPSFTFIASVNAVVWAGFEPVFVDIDPDDWHISESSLARLHDLRGSLAGILLCSTFGTAPSAARRASLAAATCALGVPVVVDSAAGFGAVDEDGRPLGDQGDVEVFSFHATKPFAIGEGGLVTSRSDGVLDTVSELVNFGFDHTRSVTGHLGINGKMPELTAAVGLTVLDRFDEVLTRRRTAAAWLRDELEPAGIAFQAGSTGSTFQFVPIALPTPAARGLLLQKAQDARIEVRAYFDPPMHRLPALTTCRQVGDLAVTGSLAERIIGLPMANDISATSLERIRDLVLSAGTTAPRGTGRRPPREPAAAAGAPGSVPGIPQPRGAALTEGDPDRPGAAPAVTPRPAQ
ncbi:DegT/DnrJ/EryC1/StrS family aminotransferase [Geodermatophilus poikilotrophus]|uniref:dTDP-4-amino-4,6-dideoxygalactose transaminase n=1 Tax=Geodermatophilus poikilotrophus TaxID=1333667 RepID=A0A1I0IF99_9ACTN|nr:DegT/DnrJ/EryC1/StrS family aminotransferase [Geodermatophilus poikilotrophus]SET95506.1 dTDP-4-amino-4,6-dideoxygalactose transaminase [Geodermatophilus poikilotrophus]